MHVLNVVTVFFTLTLIGVEFSVSAFVNPAAWRLQPDPQLQMLGRFAWVMGRVMPVWYPVCAALLFVQTWLHWHEAARNWLLAADTIFVLTSVVSMFVLVPLNTRIAQGVSDWQPLHRTWDRRHRVRIAALATAALIVTGVLVR